MFQKREVLKRWLNLVLLPTLKMMLLLMKLTIPSCVFWIWLLSLRFLLFSSRSVILVVGVNAMKMKNC